MSTRRLLLALALVSAVLASLPSGAGASGRSAFVATKVSDPAASRRAWTPERMAAARPMPMPTIEPSDLYGATPAMGEPTVIEGSRSDTRYSYRTGSETERWAAIQPISFTRTEVVDPSIAPFSAHGMIFGSSPMGDFACSGTALTSDNKSVVWTAGHCLYLEGAMSSDVVFVPGYELEDADEVDDNEVTAPHGTWAADLLAVPTQWRNNEDPRYDFAAFRVAPNASGQALGDVVPTRGIAFSQHPTEALQSFGYPGLPETKFDGEHLQTCVSVGSGRVWDGMIAMGCDMEQGSSGGGWVMRGEYVTSNVSGGNMRVWPNMGFGPYLGSAAKALYDGIRGGTAVYPQPTPSTPVTSPATVHKMKITLAMRDHLVAKGRVTAVDGFAGCAATVPVQLGKKRSDGVYYPVGKLLFTDAQGRFSTQLRDSKGQYLALADASTFDLSNRCGDAIAFARHRH